MVLTAFVFSQNPRPSKLTSVYQVIPRYILERACGFAIFTIIKAGFLFSARGGGGVVIARLDNGCKLSFPSDKSF
jgi:lipid-binding SYLF domain-containing protein